MGIYEQNLLFQEDIYGYFIVKQESLEIVDFNHCVRAKYYDEERFLLEQSWKVSDLFQEKEVIATAFENYGEEKRLQFYNLHAITAKGSCHLCDIELYFMDGLVFLLLKDKALLGRLELSSLLEMKDNPVLIVENDEDFTIFYANYRFYQVIRKTPQVLAREHGSSCLALLPPQRQGPFRDTVERQLRQHGECCGDMELLFEEHSSHLFLFHGFHSLLNGKIYGTLIPVKKQSEQMKKVEFDQQFFDIMQEFSQDLLFHIDIKKNILSHSGDVSCMEDLPSVMEDFPEVIRQYRFLHPEDVEGYISFAYRLMSGLHSGYQARLLLSNGNYESYRLQGKVLFDLEGNPVQVVGKAENMQRYVELEARAKCDALSNTLSKVSFRTLVEEQLSRAMQTDKFALLLLDFEDLAAINESQGQSVGDFLIESMGQRILLMVRNQDRVGRVGEDRFAIFLHYTPKREAVLQRAQSMLHSLKRPLQDGKVTHEIQASIGLAMYPEHGNSFQQLLEAADCALQNSKSMGKDMVAQYSPNQGSH